jgi:hypothetical protein
VDLLGISQSEMGPNVRLSRVAGARFHPAGQFALLSINIDQQLDSGSDGVAVAFRSGGQMHAQPVTGARKAIEKNSRCRIIVVDHDIKSSVVIQVCNCDPSGIFNGVAAERSCHVRKLTSLGALEQQVVLITIPTVVTDEFGAEEETVFVFLNVRDRALDERRSQIVLSFSADPAVRHVDIHVGVVVEIQRIDAPGPAGARGVTVLPFRECAVTLIAKN